MKFLLAISAIIIILTGCTSNEKNEQTQSKNKLVYGSTDYTSINPALYEHGEINSLIFSGLTARDKDNQIVPALAKSWDYNETTQTYHFSLLDNVSWHDGQPFSASDVQFTLEAILDKKNGSEIRSNYEDIANIEVVNPYAINITLKTPNVAFLEYLTVGILPKHLLENKELTTDPYNNFPIGTGPYKLQKWDLGQSITLVKNNNFYLGAPKIDTIVFKIVEDTKARALQLKAGELDLVQITPEDAALFQTNDDFTFLVMKTADYRGIMYNFNSPLFRDNPDLPNALSYAIDREAIVKSVLHGYGYPAYSPLQVGAYANTEMQQFTYNPTKAKEELEKAGWKLGSDGIYEKDGLKLAFTVNCPAGDQVRIDIANIASQQFNEIGVEMNFNIATKIDWENQDAFLIGWGSPFDPDDHTYKVFKTGAENNFNYYTNTQVDELLTKARETDSNAERQTFYNEFQTELTKQLPYTFIAYLDAIYVAPKTLQGITPETTLGHHGVGIFWNVQDWSLS